MQKIGQLKTFNFVDEGNDFEKLEKQLKKLELINVRMSSKNSFTRYRS